jgi:CheY-like chemotaxis protein
MAPAPLIPFPVSRPPASGAGKEFPVTLRRLTSPHVLVMDGHLDLLDVLGEFFHQERYSVTLSSRLLDLDRIMELAPDVIIVEAMFDGSDAGRQLIQALHGDERVRSIPVICCTTMRGLADALELDGQPTLLKPFDLDHLLTTVTEAYETRPATRSLPR